LLLTLGAKFLMPFSSEIALLASREMTHGRYRNHFWGGGILLGHILPLGLFFAIGAFGLPLAVTCAVLGLFFYEYAFVMAPQRIPNS
jgi:hypothetical protein